MRYLIPFLLFLLLPLYSQSQTLDSLKAKLLVIEEQNNELSQQIDSLNSIRRENRMQILNLEEAIRSLEFEQEKEEGILTKVTGSNGVIREQPSIMANTIVELESGDEVLVYDWFESPYVKVSYEGKMGYLSYGALEENEYVRSITGQEQVNSRLARLTEKYGKRYALRLESKELWVGMTDEMAREALGRPSDINRTTNAWGVHEQWVYPNGKYLYFEDGELMSWQD